MFIGIQIINGIEHKAVLAQTQQEIESLACIEIDKIEQVDFAVMYNGAIYTDAAELQSARQAVIRAVRDDILARDVDPVMSNIVRWTNMSESDRACYESYREYLLNYTQQNKWWESEPLNFIEWCKTNR